MENITAKFPNGKYYTFTEVDSIQHKHSGIFHLAGVITVTGQKVIAVHSNRSGTSWGAQFVTEEEYSRFLEEIRGNGDFQTLDGLYQQAMYG